MARFIEGKSYEANDCGLSPILILKRTAKMCLVRNDNGTEWRMLIRQDGDTEIMIDTSVPQKWRGAYTYNAKFETEGKE